VAPLGIGAFIGRRGVPRVDGDGALTTEADACRIRVLPGLYSAGWTDEQIREQVSFTPGRIIVSAGTWSAFDLHRVPGLANERDSWSGS
jgi:hypothetical protein